MSIDIAVRSATSPKGLVAAEDASWFAMALSLTLGEAHAPRERLPVKAECALDEVEGRRTSVALTVSARVPGTDQAGFDGAVERAAALCPVSNALRGNVEIDAHSTLES